MTIEIITMWHNEEMLAPLFRSHYKRADKITVLLDDCSDGTREHLSGCDVTEINTGSLDDILKAALLSNAGNVSNADLRVIVDADEFIYKVSSAPESFAGHAASVIFHEVFRHSTDEDYDPLDFPLHQRIHGNSIPGECFGQSHFIKPIVFPKGVRIDLAPGNHSLTNGVNVVHGFYEGAHWAMADPEIAVMRRLMKRDRMSAVNYQYGLTSHDWHVTEREILETCKQHKHDPIVINTSAECF